VRRTTIGVETRAVVAYSVLHKEFTIVTAEQWYNFQLVEKVASLLNVEFS